MELLAEEISLEVESEEFPVRDDVVLSTTMDELEGVTEVLEIGTSVVNDDEEEGVIVGLVDVSLLLEVASGLEDESGSDEVGSGELEGVAGGLQGLKISTFHPESEDSWSEELETSEAELEDATSLDDDDEESVDVEGTSVEVIGTVFELADTVSLDDDKSVDMDSISVELIDDVSGVEDITSLDDDKSVDVEGTSVEVKEVSELEDVASLKEDDKSVKAEGTSVEVEEESGVEMELGGIEELELFVILLELDATSEDDDNVDTLEEARPESVELTEALVLLLEESSVVLEGSSTLLEGSSLEFKGALVLFEDAPVLLRDVPMLLDDAPVLLLMSGAITLLVPGGTLVELPPNPDEPELAEEELDDGDVVDPTDELDDESIAYAY
ncbi:hypothetical protein P280DRAFT_526966 [Massarina eburnea CBS 473.64]|uniref:Uncharacterized protein n=1 Tax=Massarina eburnea CBS 473.64 TaxID=1395130 RepID=A0A6A6RZ98_9PLEO|nr:hypothetical protein P280DRAFT_526966 [Massarina eburnea CBS 473.64]